VLLLSNLKKKQNEPSAKVFNTTRIGP
jgi:hypothetical protein